jgi:GNAT superfamily N-acetyltransferase
MIERRRRFCGRDFFLGMPIANFPDYTPHQKAPNCRTTGAVGAELSKPKRLLMATEPLITTYLEMRSRDQLRPKRLDARFQVRERTERDWRFNRDLYFRVGEQWDWVDKRAWTDDQWKEYATAPGLRTFAGHYDEVLAGYYELRRDKEGGIEIAYFGLLPEWIGRGLGGALLTSSIEAAWLMELKPSRVWVHTCNRDHPQALANYQARGMAVYKVEREL